jgi:K(+)-stimulated pyrophosphate-energized sodium pump
MKTCVSRMDAFRSHAGGFTARALAVLALLLGGSAHASEADLVLPDFTSVHFGGAGGLDGRQLLMAGIAVCIVGLVFGFLQYAALRKLPVHRSMLEISELIY